MKKEHYKTFSVTKRSYYSSSTTLKRLLSTCLPPAAWEAWRFHQADEALTAIQERKRIHQKLNTMRTALGRDDDWQPIHDPKGSSCSLFDFEEENVKNPSCWWCDEGLDWLRYFIFLLCII